MDKNRDSYRGGFQEVCMEIDIKEAFKDCTRSQHSDGSLRGFKSYLRKIYMQLYIEETSEDGV